MAYSNTWDAAYEAAPTDSDNIIAGDNQIRAVKTNIRERMAKDHYMDLAGTDADHGEHSKVTFQAPESADPDPGANKGALYTKDVSSKAELHFQDEDDNVIQLTSGGVFNGWQAVEVATLTGATSHQFTGLTAERMYKLVLNLRTTSLAYLSVRCNNDSSALYRFVQGRHGYDATGTGSNSQLSAADTKIRIGPNNAEAYDQFDGEVLFTPRQGSSPAGKVMRVMANIHAYDETTNFYELFVNTGGQYNGAAAVTEIDLVSSQAAYGTAVLLQLVR